MTILDDIGPYRSSSPSVVEIKIERGILCVMLSGEVTLVEASTVKKMVAQATDSSLKPTGVILDLTKAGHIYSPALGRLLYLRSLSVPVTIVASPVHVALLESLGLTAVFKLSTTVTDAIAYLRKPDAV